MEELVSERVTEGSGLGGQPSVAEKLAKKNSSNTKGVHQRQLGEGGS